MTHSHAPFSLIVNLESKPACVYISRVKKDEKKERSEKSSGLRRVRKWKLSELRLVDGKSADSEVSEFDLHFDKGTFKWVAGNVMEKKAFVVCLYKLVHKYLDRKKPEFVNVDEERLQELTQIAESAKGRNGQREEEEEEVLQQGESNTCKLVSKNFWGTEILMVVKQSLKMCIV